MIAIWKFPLRPGRTEHSMPAGASVLAVQVQHHLPQMWCHVDTRMPQEPRFFDVYGTGHPMPDNPGRYIGTFQLDGGDTVWHVFEPDTPQ